MKRPPVLLLQLLLPLIAATSCSRREPVLAAACRIGSAAGPEGASLERLVVEKVPGTEGTYVAVRDWQNQWWGDFVCFEFIDGRLRWQAGVDREPDEQSIYSARGITLPGFNSAFVEVIGNTHMGHGNYYLYELDGRSLRLVLETFVLDRHQDGTLIQGPHLTVAYRDLDGDGWTDVEFTGIVEESDSEDTESGLSRFYPCRKVFTWSPSARRFIENAAARVGFDQYAGRP